MSEKIDHSIHKITIIDNRSIVRSCGQNLGYYLCKFISVLTILSLPFIFGFLYQDLYTKRTHFLGGTTDCSLSADYDKLYRYIYFIFAINILNEASSIYIGEKAFGVITLPSNIITLIINTFLLIAVRLYDLGTNANGSVNTSNISNDRRLCGLVEYISNPDNNCQKFNPSLLPLCEPFEKTVNAQFIWLNVLFGIFIIVNFIRIFASIQLKESTDYYRKLFSFVGTTFKNLEENKIPVIKQARNKIKKAEEKDLYSVIGFFEIYKTWQIILSVPIWFFHVLLGIGYFVWFGWFQQEADTVRYVFRPVGLCTVFDDVTYSNSTGWSFYFILSFVIVIWILNGTTQHFFENKIAIVSSFIGIIIHLILFIWMFVYGLSLNTNGSGYNVFNNKLFCGGFWDGGAIKDNIINKCSNSFTCPVSFDSTKLPADYTFYYVLIMLIYGFLYNIAVFIFSNTIEHYIKKYKNGSLNSDNVKSEDDRIYETLESHIVKNNDKSQNPDSALNSLKIKKLN